MMLVLSRSFGKVHPDGSKTQYMVPLADFGNHKFQRMTKWEYNAKMKGFIIKATRDIKKSEEITLVYGDKIANYNWFY